ncbi:MAG: glucosaminidase domain-containing protein [Saprospiraceae bacterium]|jgi:flagellum-specific peptidoglycan hydrolase FlgJ|nr:glucosaminidase domain-containing protein [Saprospiraceae bacterium]
MLWKFLKTNWFSIALVLIVLLAVARKSFTIFLKGTGSKNSNAKTEKYTDLAQVSDAKSLLGLMSGNQSAGQHLPEITETEAAAFFKRFSKVAQGERKKFGVPASVLLALAYVNSHAGKRPVASEATNYFALLCSNDWDGAMAQVEGHCFRRYNTPWESFRDFSIYLAAQDWYGDLRKSAGHDWQAWVKGLREVSDVLEAKAALKQVIQQYRLYELDAP